MKAYCAFDENVLMAKKRSNYDAIRKQPNSESFRYRDIRGEQDLARQKRDGPISIVPYRVGAILLSLLVVVIVYFVVSFCVWGVSSLGSAIHGTGSNILGGMLQEPNYTMAYNDELNQMGYIWDSDGEWHPEKPPSGSSSADALDSSESTIGRSIASIFVPNGWNVILTLLFGGGAFCLIYTKFKKIYDAQNIANAVKNDHVEDIHLQTIEEMLEKYDYFPDKAGHMSVQPSSIIAHIGVTNKGVKKVKIAKRAKENILDEDGEIDVYAGDILRDENDNVIFEEVSLFDEDFREGLFDASGVPKDKDLRKSFDLSKIVYNPDGSNRDKLGKYDTVADLINADCEIPYYEVGRPGGLYLVDTAPVNTMVLAITRAGGMSCNAIKYIVA